jgi:trk system potassium uptake protein TrkH
MEFVAPLPLNPSALFVLGMCHLVLVGLVGLSLAAASIRLRLGFLEERATDTIFFCAAVVALAFGDARPAGFIAILRFVMVALVNYTRRAEGARAMQWLLARPALTLVLSFLALILVGAVLLASPPARVSHEVDTSMASLFTATSAVCITGLTIVDVGTYYTRFGQWVVMALIQLGGLGVITLTGAMAVVMRRRLSMRAQGVVQEATDAETQEELRAALLGGVGITLVIELAGGLSLYASLTHDASGLPMAPPERVFYAAFHAISAYCNAGFALYPDSLVRFAEHLPVNATVTALIFLGGIGFSVLLELLTGRWLAHGPRLAWTFLSVHTKIALLSSAVLLVFGTGLFVAAEWSGVMANQPLWKIGVVSFFQSVSLRTAGFNTVDLSLLSPASLLLVMSLMFVGGSPGGTAGGVKTTTVAIIALAVRTMMRGRSDVEVFGRSIPPKQVYRAVAVVTLAGALVVVSIVLLVAMEPDAPFVPLAFEAVSAFATTGASVITTSTLKPTTQLVLCILMFVGRTGPFTLALALGRERDKVDYSYPQAKVLVG